MDKPEIESMKVETIKSHIELITPETSIEDLHKSIDFFIKQLNHAHAALERNEKVLMEALEQAQTRYKTLEKAKGSFKERLKLYIKKVLIGFGWYEASLEELKSIHFGRDD